MFAQSFPESTAGGNSPGLKTQGRSDISLAQWALVEEIRAGKWKNLDFPRIAREDFNLNGIEFVNTLVVTYPQIVQVIACKHE